MERTFEIKDNRFYIDGEHKPLICGEIHYFRMPKKFWGEALDRLVECGCNAVAYYVPWFVHEYEEGRFDFTGEMHPDNDLHTWIQMTIKYGLFGFFRPGPYVYAETTDLGIPRWFTQKYKDAVIKGYKEGVYVDTAFANGVAHNHPDFIRAVGKWYKKVCGEVKDYMAPKGNIVLFQLCNEIPGDDCDDRNPVTLGIGNKVGIWPAYLQNKYGTVDKLNYYYKSDFKYFEWIEPHHLEQAMPDLYTHDHLEFYYSCYYPSYFQSLKKMADENGINVEFVHNAYNPRAVSLHYQNKKKNPWLNIGIDCYYSLTGNLGMKEATYFCEYGAEYAGKFLNNVPWVVEQECGYWHDYPVVYGPELYIWNIWTMACGYQGMNMYLFASGINRPEMGFFGTEHNWQAPVDFRGMAGEAYPYVQQSIGDILENKDVFLDDILYDIGFGIKHTPGLIWRPSAKAASDAYFVLKSAGYTPCICDFESADENELDRHKSLFIVSDQSMDEAQQKALEGYVKRGGILIINGVVPYKNMMEESLRVLLEVFGMEAEPGVFENEHQQKLILNDTEYYIGKCVQTIKAGNAKVLARTADKRPGALYMQYGMGQVLILPFPLEMLFHGMAEAVRSLLEITGVYPSVTGAKKLRIIPKQCGKYVALNLHPVTVKEFVEVSAKGLKKEILLELTPYSFKVF